MSQLTHHQFILNTPRFLAVKFVLSHFDQPQCSYTPFWRQRELDRYQSNPGSRKSKEAIKTRWKEKIAKKDEEIRKNEENFNREVTEVTERLKTVELEKEELMSKLSAEKFENEQKIADLLRDIADLEAANNQGGYTMTQCDRNNLEIQRKG